MNGRSQCREAAIGWTDPPKCNDCVSLYGGVCACDCFGCIDERDRHAVPEPSLSPAVQLEPKVEPLIRSFYVTKALLDRHGMTAGCPKCSTGKGHQSAECRVRIEEAQTAEYATT